MLTASVMRASNITSMTHGAQVSQILFGLEAGFCVKRFDKMSKCGRHFESTATLSHQRAVMQYNPSQTLSNAGDSYLSYLFCALVDSQIVLSRFPSNARCHCLRNGNPWTRSPKKIGSRNVFFLLNLVLPRHLGWNAVAADCRIGSHDIRVLHALQK